MRGKRAPAEATLRRREEVRRMTLQGHTAPEIAAALGITTRTVQRDRGATGVAEPGPQPVPEDVLTRAEQFLDDGCSYTEVSRTLNVAVITLRKHFPGRGFTKEQTIEATVMSNRFRHSQRRHLDRQVRATTLRQEVA